MKPLSRSIRPAVENIVGAAAAAALRLSASARRVRTELIVTAHTKQMSKIVICIMLLYKQLSRVNYYGPDTTAMKV